MTDTYLNPVYPHAAPDPFVLKFRGEYWCYATGLRPCADDNAPGSNGEAFTILHSPDLVYWTEVGPALQVLPGNHTCYWAPEVLYWNGIFYFYYSVGNETTMTIRVATAPTSAGPFKDQGIALTSEPFAIDPHIYMEDADHWYLFYATDFLTHNHVGTGTVVDRLNGPLALAGRPRPVTRARFDWQVYDPARKEKGGVRWHTIEGSYVLKHNGRYYQMFSGGNWQNLTYGVAYGVTDDIDSEEEWVQPCDGVNKQPILMSDPSRGVIGPGHNSAVRSPNNRELFCVYHRWDPVENARVLAIDRMGWEGDDLKVYGPTSEPQAIPAQPEVKGLELFEVMQGSLERIEPNLWRLLPDGDVEARAALEWSAPGLLFEVTYRMADAGSARGEAGVLLKFGSSDGRLTLGPAEALLVLKDQAVRAALPKDFDPRAFHLLHVEQCLESIEVNIDGNAVRLEIPAQNSVTGVGLWASSAAEFSGIEVSK